MSLFCLSRSNPHDNVEVPNKRSHFDPDLSPEPSKSEDLLVPNTASDHSQSVECEVIDLGVVVRK